MRAQPSRFLTTLTLAALLLGACGRFRSGDSSSRLGGSVVAGLPQIGSIDPADATSPSALLVLRTACDGLIGLDYRSGATKPALATAWTLSDGARRLSVTLREGVDFQDGNPVTAASIREALSRVARPSSASPWASLVSRVEGFAEVQSGAATHLSGIREEEAGLSIRLSEPFSDFATVLAHPALIPVSLQSLRKTPEGPDLPVCSGPYRIQKGGEGSDLRLGRVSGSRGANEGYRNGGRGEADLILIRSFDSGEDAYQAYRNGQVDIAEVPDSLVGEARQLEGYASRPTPQVTFLGFNPASPETADPRLRQAVSLAIDRLAIIDAAFGDQRMPAGGWLPTGTADESTCGSFVRRISDPGRAKQLLLSSPVDPDEFRLSVYFDPAATSRRLVEALELQIEQVLGIDVVPTALEGQELATHVVNKPPGASAWLLSTTINLPVLDEFVATPFRTGSSANVLGFSDPQFDRRVDEARRATTPAAVTEGYSQAESELCSAMPAIPLWTGVSRWIFNPEQVGVAGEDRFDSLGSPLLRHAHAANG